MKSIKISAQCVDSLIKCLAFIPFENKLQFNYELWNGYCVNFSIYVWISWKELYQNSEGYDAEWSI